MAIQCLGTPTLTEFATITSNSISTSFSQNVQEIPPIISTSLSVSCLVNLLNISVCSTATFVTTIPGSVNTVQVPITLDVPVILTQPTQTLYAPCNTDTLSNNARTSFIMSQSTPPPFIFYSQSSLTMPDGSVVVESITITSSLSPTIVYIPTTRPTNQQDPANGDHISTIAPIVGGVIGGFFGLLIIVAVIWFLLRRRQSYIYEQDETEPPRNTTNRKRRFELDVDTEPKPYQYGLVGQVNSSLINSPPASPTFPPPNNVNNHNNNLDASHGRQRSSLTPLMLSPSTTPTPAQSLPTTASSRPSTAGSAYPLRGGSSRPSTAGSGPNNQQQRPQSQLDHLDEFGVRPLSSQSHTGGSSWSRQSPQPPPVVAPHNWTSMAAASPPPEREGSPVSLKEPKRMLQIVNAPPSPTISIASTPDLHQFAEADLGEPPSSPLPPPSRKRPIIVHQDAGSVEPAVIVTAPPSYDG